MNIAAIDDELLSIPDDGEHDIINDDDDNNSFTTNDHVPMHLTNLSQMALDALDHLDDTLGVALGCHHSCSSGANNNNNLNNINHLNHPNHHHLKLGDVDVDVGVIAGGEYDPLKSILNNHHHHLPPLHSEETGSTTSIQHGSIKSILSHGNHSNTSHTDHKILVDALLNNSSSTLNGARERAESWGGMSDLSHAAAIISAGTTTAGVMGMGMGIGIGGTLGGGSGTMVGEGGGGGNGSSSSPVLHAISGIGAAGDMGGMRPASPPSVAGTASFELLLSSSPRSMNTISGCGISVDGGGSVSGCGGSLSNGGSHVGGGGVSGCGGNNGVGVGCGGSNGSLGIAALEGVDLISSSNTRPTPKIGFGVPIRIAVPELGNGKNKNGHSNGGDLLVLEKEVEREEEEAMMADIGLSVSGNNGYWRERIDSISMGSIFNRERNDSLSSLFLPSRKDSFAAAASLSGAVSLHQRERFDSLASLGECSMNMSIADLADVAGALESVVAQSSSAVDGGSSCEGGMNNISCKVEQDAGNAAENFPPPTIQVDPDAVQAAVQAAMAATSNNIYDMLKIGPSKQQPQQQQKHQKQKQHYSTINSTSKQKKAMVKIESMVKIEPNEQQLLALPPPCMSTTFTNTKPKKPRVPFTVAKVQSSIPDSSRTSEKEMEAIRARARAAAGYVPPTINTKTNANTSKSVSTPSLKRRTSSNHHHHHHHHPGYSAATNKRPRTTSSSSNHHRLSSPPLHSISSSYNSSTKTSLPTGVVHLCASNFTTPKRANTKKGANKNKGSGTQTNTGLANHPTSANKNSSAKGQSEQKWEEMYQCLVAYVQEQKEKETRGMTKEEATEYLIAWEWSGNVPTMYKRKDGKALGRWINNQRSAKSKGTLKVDREVRLVSTGLKWSVLTTNAWTDMMEELRIYVREQTKNGGDWNGNVPTNYKIKNNTATDGSEIDEDKNLGRWINRQRSLYQADKLKKERQIELEKVGLKWAVLSTTSWHAMYDTLCKYAQERRDSDENSYWDGNVPASHETDDKPPKRLGRWVNRQRSAYATEKLKKEFVIKLEKIGLKWTAHDKKLLTKANGEIDGEIPSLKTNVVRIIPIIATSMSEAVLQNGKKIDVSQHRKNGHEPALFLNGKGHDSISAPKLPVLPALAHTNISNAKMAILR